MANRWANCGNSADFIFWAPESLQIVTEAMKLKDSCSLEVEKAMATHCSTLAWKIPWAEEPAACSPWGREESDTTERLHFDFSVSCIGEGNGNPLQYSCLENPRDGKAW